MDVNYVKKMSKAFYEGVKEFGIVEAINKINENCSVNDPKSQQIFVTSFVSLIAMIFPELMNNDNFLNSIAETMEKMPKEEIDERVNMLIQSYTDEGI